MVKSNSLSYTLTRRHLIRIASTFAVFPFFHRSIFGKEIPVLLLAARIWPSAEYTRITLESDQEISEIQFLFNDPYQFALDIGNLKLDTKILGALFKSRTYDPHIDKIRIFLKKEFNFVQMIFDLKKLVSPQIFSLKPAGNYHSRLIIDFYPMFSNQVSKHYPANQSSYVSCNSPKDIIAAIVNNPEIADLASIESTSLRKNKENPENSEELFKRKHNGLIIALDPGHGGEDPGAIGKTGLFEKDVVLKIAKHLKSLVDKQNMNAYLTRDEDYFLPLNARVHKARKMKADLLISIHANACIKPSVHGSSVFVLSQIGTSSSNYASWIADRENASDLVGGVNLTKKERNLLEVLIDLSTSAQIRDSLKIGTVFLHELSKINRLHKNSVEQANFTILKAPDIPSVLVETAFISNPKEEAMLKSELYQKKLASAIFAGINSYFLKNP